LAATYVVFAEEAQISENATPDKQIGRSQQDSTHLIWTAQLQILVLFPHIYL